ncbi:MAG: hypothetical protein IKP62_03135 [Salinivirgaceae bacterium]|nr:hypothetical protein [Salinivirgaceae bacterium]
MLIAHRTIRNLAIALTAMVACPAHGQSLGAFTDYDKHFIVFDDGNFRQLEFQEVMSYAVGSGCVAYVNNGGHLKAYANHITYNVSPSVERYSITDNLFTFQVGTQLYVFEQGSKRLLTGYVGSFMVGDSVVAFIDTNKHFFSIYTDGRVTELADIIVGNDAPFWVGANTVAFVDMHEVLRLVCGGRVYELFNVIDKISVELERNIGAFIDHSDGAFRIFYNGELNDIEQFTPKSFKCGYEQVAFVNSMENFRLFSKGELYDISGFAPDMYDVNRNTLVYSLQGEFFTFVDGQQYLVENYVPRSYSINGNLLTYIDQNGYLAVFEDGEKHILSYGPVNSYSAVGDVVVFNEGLNTTKIYYNGKTYKR